MNKDLKDQLEILDLMVLMESLAIQVLRAPRDLTVFKDRMDPAVPRDQREHKEDPEAQVPMEPEVTQDRQGPRELAERLVMWEALEMMEFKASKDLRVPRDRRERREIR